MREQLISQIRTLAKTEKYKQDSFFFCGSPSDLPNEELLSACEAYLDCAKAGQNDPGAAERLVRELETIAPPRPAGFVPDDAGAGALANALLIWNILDHRSEL